MYFIDTLYYLYKPVKRKPLFDISKSLSDGNFFKQLYIILDMIYCSLIYGAMFTEYGDLGFYYRKRSNRKTYLTTFYNFNLYDKVNQKKSRILFHNKLLFLKHFSSYIKRDWIDLTQCSKKQLESFINGKQSIVLKASMGDSGKEVHIVELNSFNSTDALLSFAHANNFDLAEECIFNCKELQKLNNTSLNTLRITTLVVNGVVNVLFAGLRVGAKGAKVDNISQGGFVARVDIETGVVNSNFYRKESSTNDDNTIESIIGFQIPYWKDVISLINEIALYQQDIQFVSWDICITPTGPDVIEANESFGSVILQIFNDYNECGLKPIVEKVLFQH